jgi:hypothetical protein
LGFSDGLIVVKQSGKYGYLNKQGKIEIELLFEKAEPFFGSFVN